jgi:hypothetical protein
LNQSSRASRVNSELEPRKRRIGLQADMTQTPNDGSLLTQGTPQINSSAQTAVACMVLVSIIVYCVWNRQLPDGLLLFFAVLALCGVAFGLIQLQTQLLVRTDRLEYKTWQTRREVWFRHITGLGADAVTWAGQLPDRYGIMLHLRTDEQTFSIDLNVFENHQELLKTILEQVQRIQASARIDPELRARTVQAKPNLEIPRPRREPMPILVPAPDGLEQLRKVLSAIGASAQAERVARVIVAYQTGAMTNKDLRIELERLEEFTGPIAELRERILQRLE